MDDDEMTEFQKKLIKILKAVILLAFGVFWILFMPGDVRWLGSLSVFYGLFELI